MNSWGISSFEILESLETQSVIQTRFKFIFIIRQILTTFSKHIFDNKFELSLCKDESLTIRMAHRLHRIQVSFDELLRPIGLERDEFLGILVPI